MRSSFLLVLFLFCDFFSVQAQKFQLSGLSALEDSLAFIQQIEESEARNAHLDQFWDSLKHHQLIPFTSGNDAVFMYRSNANSVSWNGDFNNWGAFEILKPEKVEGTDLWIGKTRFASDARLDYKIVDDTNWILDPNNPHQQWSGFGPNSELRMPDYHFPEEILVKDEVTKGNLSGNIGIHSTFLEKTINYKIYTPFNYSDEEIKNVPVVYVTDGHEYSDTKLGHMTIVLDNLIFDKKLPPILAVFIDPRINGQNERIPLYVENPDFADFIVQELIPEIEEKYKAAAFSGSRAIMGTSLGGLHAAYMALRHPGVFDNIAMHSPALSHSSGLAEQIKADNLPPNFFISTGTIFDTEDDAEKFYNNLAKFNDNIKYVRVNDGHSWGNWKALIDDPLLYFWGVDKGRKPASPKK